MREAHTAIERMLEEAATTEPDAGHGTWRTEILPLIARRCLGGGCFIGSSWTTSAFDRMPAWVPMDRGRDGGGVHATELPVARAASVVRADQLGDLGETVTRLLTSGSQIQTRSEVRREYFGDLDIGASTGRFQSVVRDLVAHRDRAMARFGMASSVGASQEASA